MMITLQVRWPEEYLNASNYNDVKTTAALMRIMRIWVISEIFGELFLAAVVYFLEILNAENGGRVKLLCRHCIILYHAVSLLQVMHGGLFAEDNVTLDDIRKVERNRQPPESG